MYQIIVQKDMNKFKNSIIDIRIYLPVNSSIFATLDPGFVWGKN